MYGSRVKERITGDLISGSEIQQRPGLAPPPLRSWATRGGNHAPARQLSRPPPRRATHFPSTVHSTCFLCPSSHPSPGHTPAATQDRQAGCTLRHRVDPQVVAPTGPRARHRPQPDKLAEHRHAHLVRLRAVASQEKGTDQDERVHLDAVPQLLGASAHSSVVRDVDARALAAEVDAHAPDNNKQFILFSPIFFFFYIFFFPFLFFPPSYFFSFLLFSFFYIFPFSFFPSLTFFSFQQFISFSPIFFFYIFSHLTFFLFSYFLFFYIFPFSFLPSPYFFSLSFSFPHFFLSSWVLLPHPYQLKWLTQL
jgi:hypothetical protein